MPTNGCSCSPRRRKNRWDHSGRSSACGLEAAANRPLSRKLLREVGDKWAPTYRSGPWAHVVHAQTFHFDAHVPYAIGIHYLLAYDGGAVQPGDCVAGARYRWWSLEESSATTVLPPSRLSSGMLHRAPPLSAVWAPSASSSCCTPPSTRRDRRARRAEGRGEDVASRCRAIWGAPGANFWDPDRVARPSFGSRHPRPNTAGARSPCHQAQQPSSSSSAAAARISNGAGKPRGLDTLHPANRPLSPDNLSRDVAPRMPVALGLPLAMFHGLRTPREQGIRVSVPISGFTARSDLRQVPVLPRRRRGRVAEGGGLLNCECVLRNQWLRTLFAVTSQYPSRGREAQGAGLLNQYTWERVSRVRIPSGSAKNLVLKTSDDLKTQC